MIEAEVVLPVDVCGHSFVLPALYRSSPSGVEHCDAVDLLVLIRAKYSLSGSETCLVTHNKLLSENVLSGAYTVP